MKPGEEITSYYNLDPIAGYTVREIEARDVLDFTVSRFRPEVAISVNSELLDLIRMLREKIDVMVNPYSSTGALGEAYETFDHEGQLFETRILHINVAGSQLTYKTEDIYLLALLGKGQKQISLINCRFGVVITEDNQRIFFKVESPLDEVPGDEADVPTPNIITVLSPQEQYMVLEELRKSANGFPGSSTAS
jgi:hypothetical protein